MNNNINRNILTIVWPFFGLVNALRNWRQPWGMNVFWVVCAYMGAIQIYHPKGTILGEGSDAGRYVLELQEMHRSVNSFEEVSRYFYDGDTNDVFCSTLQYVVSRFTENGHVFFFVLAIIYGFFYSRNIWYILNRISEWCEYRNEVVHAVLNKNLNSLYSELRDRVEDGMALGRIIDKQISAMKRRDNVRKALKLK